MLWRLRYRNFPYVLPTINLHVTCGISLLAKQVDLKLWWFNTFKCSYLYRNHKDCTKQDSALSLLPQLWAVPNAHKLCYRQKNHNSPVSVCNNNRKLMGIRKDVWEHCQKWNDVLVSLCRLNLFAFWLFACLQLNLCNHNPATCRNLLFLKSGHVVKKIQIKYKYWIICCVLTVHV